MLYCVTVVMAVELKDFSTEPVILQIHTKIILSKLTSTLCWQVPGANWFKSIPLTLIKSICGYFNLPVHHHQTEICVQYGGQPFPINWN